MRPLNTMTGVSALGLAALIGVASAPAQAQNTVRGQGATLPAGLYADWFTPAPVPGFAFSYNAPLVRRNGGEIAANTGSSAGKAAFESHLFNNNVFTPVAGQPTQPLPADITTAQKEDIQFAGADAILNTNDLDNYATARWGQPIQVPSVGTPVTISYNAVGLRRTRRGPTGLVSPTTGRQSISSIIYLSRASYCGIFTGQIANWNHPRIVADNGVAPSTLPIKVVVRSDGSGTTEIFTRHLDTVCDGSASAGGYRFPDTRPAGSPASAKPTGVTTFNWASLIGASRLILAPGNGGVSTAIAANRNSIGYLSPDFTNIVATPASGSGTPLPVPANLQNRADLNAGRNNNYTHSPAFPNVIAAQTAIAAPLVTESALVWGQRLALTDPRANNPTAANAYPIVGFTFLDFYTCYPRNRITGVRGFISYVTTTSTAAGSADTKAKQDGFAPLAANLKNAVRARTFATGASPRGISAGPISGVCSL